MALPGIPIPKTQCIGDSLFSINNALTSLDIAVTAASNSGVTKITAGTNVSVSPTGGTGDVTVNATMPCRLGESSCSITDWNSATANGWYMADGAANSPGTGWYMGYTQSHNSNWTTQIVHAFSGNNAVWKREQNNGAWGPWTQYADVTQAEYTALQTNITTVMNSFGPDGKLKLAVGGGLEFNGDGALQLTPPGETSTYLVVRPSDVGATDNGNVMRTSIGGELRPCFKTVLAAVNYARNNIAASVAIFVDEDTDETQATGSIGWLAGSNVEYRYFNQAEVTASFGNHPILKAGVYVFSTNGDVPKFGTVNTYSGSSLAQTITIESRYNRGTYWTTWRKINEHPKQMRYHLYVCNELTRRMSNGLGSNADVWTNSPWQYPNPNNNFQIVRPFVSKSSTINFINLNFVVRSNTLDCTMYEPTGDSFITFSNITFTILGSHLNYYGALYVTDKATLRVDSYHLRNSTDTGWAPRDYSYGIAVLGNTSATASGSGWFGKYTHLWKLIWLNRGGTYNGINFDAFSLYRTPGSIIVDGLFTGMDEYIFLAAGSNFYNNNCFLSTSTTAVSSTYVNSININTGTYTLANKSTVPITIQKLCNLVVDFDSRAMPPGITEPSTIPYDYFSGASDYQWNISGGNSVIDTTIDEYKATSWSVNTISHKRVSQLPKVDQVYSALGDGPVSYGQNARL